MSTCARCGASVEAADQFCPSCGAPVAAPAATAPAVAPHPSAVSAVAPWEIVVLAAGGVALIASFLAFYKVSVDGHSESWSAWSNAFSLFPAVTLSVLALVAVAVVVALLRFAPDVKLPDAIARDWNAISTLITVLAALTIVAFALRSFKGGFERGIGAWLLLLAAIAAVVGIVMRQLAAGSATATQAAASGGSRTLAPFALVLLAGAVVALLGSFLDVFGVGSSSVNAWSSDGMLPAITLPAILVAIAAVLTLLTQLGQLGAGTSLLGVPLSRWIRALCIDGAALAVCYLVGDPAISGAADHKIGFWLMLLGTVAAAVAAVMGPRLQFPTASAPHADQT